MKKFKFSRNDKVDTKTEEIKSSQVLVNLQKDDRFTINIIAFVLMMIMAFGIIMFYPKLIDISKEQKSSPYEDYNLMENIRQSDLIIYKDMVEKTSESEKSLEDIYIKSYSDKYNHTDIDSESIRSNYEKNILNPLKSRIYERQSILDFELKNLEYAAFDKNGILITNRGLDIIDKISSYDELKDSYGFYVVINYDDTGFPTITDYYGIDYDYIKNIFLRNIDGYSAKDYDKFSIEYNRITDTTIVYAIPKYLKYSDNIYDIVNRFDENYVAKDVIMEFGLTIGVTVLLIGLIVPFELERKIAGFKKILNIPFETCFILYSVSFVFLMFFVSSMVKVTANGKSVEMLQYLKMSTPYDNIVIYFVNFLVWIAVIYFILSGMTYIKGIFEYGFKRYLKEKVIVIRCLRFMIRKAKCGFDYLSHIDLRDKSNKVIIKVLTVNFIVISGISVIWLFGVFPALIYNVILFIVIRKYYDRVRENYKSLLNATNKIADGNLDFEISEDLGIFNSFKDELKKIQSGFKKAVDEEVKSQKMKTDLISNVSHDLKTPLTSIITYVDLLKNDNITEDERKSYVETIDKKSQRLKFLIEDLFEVSKATSGNIQLNPVDVDIIELIKQVEFELSDKIQNADLKMKNNFPDGRIILKVDSQKTFRVFENLFSNVAKYSMEGSRVYVDIIENVADVTVIIKNMSAAEIDYKADEIVERFQRGDKSRNTEGSGLGLAIAKSFIEAQNGKFKIELDGDLFKVIIIFKK